MSKTILNLTMPVIVEVIERVINTYPHHPYQQAFAIPELRQELITYVLNRVSNLYIVDENRQPISKQTKTLDSSLEQKLYIESVICEGIERIIRNRSEKISHQIPGELDPGFAPSNWFG